MNNSLHSWLSPEGASAEALKELQAEVKGLPLAYIEILHMGNGGEVGLKVAPYNLCLDSAEEALDYWKSGTYTISGLFVFASDGGGTLLAMDMCQSGSSPIVSFDPIDPEGSMEQVALDFLELMSQIEGNA